MPGESVFNNRQADAQSTEVEPVSPDRFDFKAFIEYEAKLLNRCRMFWGASSGVLVHRRFRVANVFAHGCQDMAESLAWQLGALRSSMEFAGDVPNYLEPWYGIGTVASAFGLDYIWNENQAPATRPRFQSAREALDHPVTPISETPIGRHTLRMIDYFIEKTDGLLPISLCDTQSPLNVACHLIETDRFFTDFYLDPESVRDLLDRLAVMIADFSEVQRKRIGERLVLPGHGFASSRCFEGLGMSDDNAVMISGEQYQDFISPAMTRAGELFGGAVFHSCGNWSDKIDVIHRIHGLRAVDGAFSGMTDPAPNPPELFGEPFAGTGIVVNARIVGGVDVVEQVVRRLWKPGLKLIVVTYCETPKEQAEAYERIHRICEA